MCASKEPTHDRRLFYLLDLYVFGMLKLRPPGEEGGKTAEPPTSRLKSAKFARYAAARSIPLPETSYTLPVAIDIRIRHYHRTQARRVTEFVVQLEIEIRNEWKPVIGTIAPMDSLTSTGIIYEGENGHEASREEDGREESRSIIRI